MIQSPFRSELLIKLLLIVLLIMMMNACVPADNVEDARSISTNQEGSPQTFQEFLWYQNPIVLILQIGLMIAGSIGVSALLPAPDEEKPSK